MVLKCKDEINNVKRVIDKWDKSIASMHQSVVSTAYTKILRDFEEAIKYGKYSGLK